MHVAQPAELKPITVTVEQAKRITNLGATTLYSLLASGKLESVAIGGRRLIRYDSIERLLAPAAPDQAA